MIDDLLKIGHEASKNILKFYRQPKLEVLKKKDGSPQTPADTSTDTLIHSRLSEKFGLPVISEESYDGSSQNLTEGFIVDPLDGTKDFLERNDEFSVNIAYVKERRVEIGIILAPAKDSIHFAIRGEGTFRVEKGKRVRLRPQALKEKVAVISRHHANLATLNFLKKSGIVKTLSIGSALKFTAMAEGIANIYPRFVGSKEWDIAAGDLILEETGGTIFTLPTGERPKYFKSSPENLYFLALSSEFRFEDFERSLVE